MRTIRVTGKGQINVKPDMTRITLTLEGTFPEYGEALRHSSEDTERLRNVLAPFGFQRSDLKTTRFDIDTRYESYRENGEYRQHFIGYQFKHTMKVEFDSDNERMNKVLSALAHSAVRPEIRISYTVKDQEAAKNKLLGRAVTDAKEKAAVLTQAAGVTLGSIQSVDYSWGKIDVEYRPMQKAMCADGSAEVDEFLNIEPDDIFLSDTVTVVWEIS